MGENWCNSWLLKAGTSVADLYDLTPDHLGKNYVDGQKLESGGGDRPV